MEPSSERSTGQDPPTYESLSEKEPLNSRFGRWHDWIEKRALERYNSDSQAARKKRSSGDIGALSDLSPAPPDYPEFDPEILTIGQLPSTNPSESQRVSVGERLIPSNASVHRFGSRFIPHSTYRINAILPILSDRFLLIGSDDGLSVLDTLPALHGGTSVSNTGILSLRDAKTRIIWTGDAVHQLELLEMSPSDTTGVLQGVILALVSSNLPGEVQKKSVRMYSLASLCNLVTLMVNQPGTVQVDLGRPTGWSNAESQTKRHRNSITRIFSVLDFSTPQKPPQSSLTSSYPSNSPSGDPAWDIIDDLPLKWAKDYVPLTLAHSKLADGEALKFELFRIDDQLRNGSSVLAVATKNSIYIFESSRGERAFRFVQELYTPSTITHMRFVYQTTTGVFRHFTGPGGPRHNRHSSDTSGLRSNSFHVSRSSASRISLTSSVFSSQLCLFVCFDSRASIIRLSDSAVEEIFPYEDPLPPSPSQGSGRPHQFEHFQDVTVGPWLPIAYLKLPPPPVIQADPIAAKFFTTSLKDIYILTKGRRTYIQQSPLPNPLSSVKPLLEVTWKEQSSEVIPRICTHTEPPSNTTSNSDTTTPELRLQLISFNCTGIEIIEVPVSAIYAASRGDLATQTSLRGHGKGRALPAPPIVDPVRAQVDFGGETMFLSTGGQWHDYKGFERVQLERTHSTTSTLFTEQMKDCSGVYACYEKAPNDYRVFFVGDYATGDELLEDESDGF